MKHEISLNERPQLPVAHYVKTVANHFPRSQGRGARTCRTVWAVTIACEKRVSPVFWQVRAIRERLRI